MNLFGKTNPDLPLLRCSEGQLQELVQEGSQYGLLKEQLAHHCIRTAWLESRHASIPVRRLLEEVTAHAYAVLYTHAPLDMGPFEPIGVEDIISSVGDVRRMHDKDVCLGFLLDTEAATLHEVATGGDPENLRHGLLGSGVFWEYQVEVPPVYVDTHFSLDNMPPLDSFEQEAYAMLLVLRRWWSLCSARIVTDALSRETVRRVTQVMGKASAQPDLALLDWRIENVRKHLVASKQLVPRLRAS